MNIGKWPSEILYGFFNGNNLGEIPKMSKQEPYLHVSLEADGPRVIGTPSQSLGQVNLPESLQTGKDVFAEWQWDGNTVVV